VNVAPGSAYEAVVEWGTSGLAIGMRVIDNEGATTVARVTGFSEYPPGSGIYQRAGNIAPADAGSYSLVFDDDGGAAAAGHVAVDTLTVTYSAPADPTPGPPAHSYVSRDELQRVLGKASPTPAEVDAMDRVLEAAASEIDWDLGYTVDNPAPTPTPPIVVDVNLDRASELWRFNFSTSGILPQGPDIGPIVAPQNTWRRHHYRLSPLRVHVGIA
jgi:hypothetical protein